MNDVVPSDDAAETAGDRAVILRRKIDERRAVVGVVGLGYVGLPLAVALAEAGFRVVGIDVDAFRVSEVNAGRSPIQDVSDDRLGAAVAAGRLSASSTYDVVPDCDIVFVCVPTPFDAYKTPDLSFVRAAADGIAQHVRPGQLVVLQSTTYPGTTEEVIRPRLEVDDMVAGRDFFLAFSPERIDPGVPDHTVLNTPKVVGGVTEGCTDLAAALLASLGPEVHRVSSPRAAEMTKLLENIYRAVNIALVNELALLCERMDIDVWEVIQAAATKPFGFMPFHPGPGVGGHCIPVDPHYLAWKAREHDFSTRFIELAAEINSRMPQHVLDLCIRALELDGRPLAGSAVLVLGVAFKPDVDDPRNSPAERLIELLLERGADVGYHDPFVDEFRVGDSAFHRRPEVLHSVPLTDEALRAADVVVIVTGHRSLDYERVARLSRRLVDATNATRGVADDRVVRLGTPSRGLVLESQAEPA
jgi:UDP-N-acetyl-D-glucosamine dehydrogenase